MIKLLTIVVAVLVFLPFSDWKLKKEKEGIKVYTREVNGSTFAEFKAETTLENTTLLAVLDIIFDVPGYVNLYPDCMNPKVLKQNSKYDMIQYVQTKGPFTVKDRDSVVEMKASFSNNGKQVKVLMRHIPDYIPENEKMVRIQKGSGFWEIDETTTGKVHVVYQFHSEPAGEIPAWIANTFLETFPFQTMKNLNKLIKTNAGK